MFTKDERRKFSDWISKLEHLSQDLRGLEAFISAKFQEKGGYYDNTATARQRHELWRAFEHHLDHAPPNMKPQRIIFGGGGMGSVYGPDIKAPGDSLPDFDGHDEPPTIRIPDEPATVNTASQVSAGVGAPIYQDPLAYKDWGWTKHDPRPVPKPTPMPSTGGAEARSVK